MLSENSKVPDVTSIERRGSLATPSKGTTRTDVYVYSDSI